MYRNNVVNIPRALSCQRRESSEIQFLFFSELLASFFFLPSLQIRQSFFFGESLACFRSGHGRKESEYELLCRSQVVSGGSNLVASITVRPDTIMIHLTA